MRLRHGLTTALGLSLFFLVASPALAQDVDQSCLDAGISDSESCSAYLAAPAEEEPAVEEAPAEEPYVEEAPAEEPYAEEAPAEEPYVEEAPAEEPYVEEAPAEEEPYVEEAPAEEPYVEEAPAEEPVIEEPQAEEEPYVEEQPADAEPAAEEAPVEDQPFVAPEAAEEQPADEQPAVDEVQPDEAVPAENTEQADEIAPDEQPAVEAPAEAPQAETATEAEQPVADETLVTEDAADEPVVAEEQLTEADDPLAAMPEAPLDEATEPLPEGAVAEEASPLLDSAKEGDYTAAQLEAAAAEEPVAQPETDEEAQVAPAVDTAEVEGLNARGTALTAAPQFVTPQNVTIINNNTTVTNNTTNVTNNTVNNVTNNTYVYQVNNTTVINNTYEEQQRLYRDGDNHDYDQIGDNRFRETVYRRDGSRVVTVRDQYGNMLERYVVDTDDNSYVLAYFEPRYYDDLQYWNDPGDSLPPIRLTISFRDYVMDWRYADEDQIYRFFGQPPVEKARRLYSVDEVKRSARLRDSVRRLEVGNLSFASGAATLPKSQVQALSKVAKAMQRVLDKNPAETFLIEGHSDAVGSERSNLVLSDKRANTVARILTQYYDIPPENLATQGYGERYLRVKTQRAEPENRRVTIRRITPLVAPTARR